MNGSEPVTFNVVSKNEMFVLDKGGTLYRKLNGFNDGFPNAQAISTGEKVYVAPGTNVIRTRVTL